MTPIVRTVLWLMAATSLTAQPERATAAEGRERPAGPHEQFSDAAGHLSPAAFEFVMPGVTRREVDKRLGKPYVSSGSVVVQGRIDLFVDEPRMQPPGNGKPQLTEEVRYYDYRPRGHASEFARIVFRGDKIWYAMLPAHSAQATRAGVIATYGNVFEEQKLHRKDGHVLTVDVILWLRKKGLAFIEKPGEGITHRVVFPAEP
jgi:hypothetical protein